MAYDPTKPASGAPIVSAELRTQLTGLKALIDAVPASAAMTAVLASSTSGSCLGVAAASTAVSNPPTQLQVQALALKLNELLAALQRSAPS